MTDDGRLGAHRRRYRNQTAVAYCQQICARPQDTSGLIATCSNCGVENSSEARQRFAGVLCAVITGGMLALSD